MQKHRRRHRRLRKTTPRPDSPAEGGGEAEREEVPEVPVFMGREDTEAENLELGMVERLDEKRFQVSHKSTRCILVPSFMFPIKCTVHTAFNEIDRLKN